jgi:hypothetical protein
MVCDWSAMERIKETGVDHICRTLLMLMFCSAMLYLDIWIFLCFPDSSPRVGDLALGKHPHPPFPGKP